MRQLGDLALLLGFREFAIATYKLAAQVGAAAGACKPALHWALYRYYADQRSCALNACALLSDPANICF